MVIYRRRKALAKGEYWPDKHPLWRAIRDRGLKQRWVSDLTGISEAQLSNYLTSWDYMPAPVIHQIKWAIEELSLERPENGQTG